MPRDEFHWLDIERIGEELELAHPQLDPLAIRFPELRDKVRSLPGFHELPGHPVNEKILEAIQAAWIQERSGAPRDDDD